MRCFYHPESEAVGICKSCQKGVCPACAADLGKGLACRERCESDVTAINEVVARSVEMGPLGRSIVQGQPTSLLVGSILFLMMGIVFVGWGVLSDHHVPSMVVLGAGFTLYGAFQLSRALRLRQRRG